MGAPVRVADTLMTRPAAQVTDDDLLGPFLDHPAGPLPEPRNLAFASGLGDWIIGGRFLVTRGWPRGTRSPHIDRRVLF